MYHLLSWHTKRPMNTLPLSREWIFSQYIWVYQFLKRWNFPNTFQAPILISPFTEFLTNLKYVVAFFYPIRYSQMIYRDCFFPHNMMLVDISLITHIYSFIYLLKDSIDKTNMKSKSRFCIISWLPSKVVKNIISNTSIVNNI